MKGGNPTTIYILLADSTPDGSKIEWKDKPPSILLSGNSIFAATEIMKIRQINGTNVLSPENISRLQYKETTYPEIIKSIPLLEFITNKLNEAQSDTNGVDDGISVIPNHTWWKNDSGFTKKKIIKHIINSDDKNHPVYCKLVEGNVTIQFDIDESGYDPRFIDVKLNITYTIIADLDGIIRCVIVKYTITNTNLVIESNAAGIKNVIQTRIILDLVDKLKKKEPIEKLSDYVYDISVKYNIDKKNIIKYYINYIIRNNSQVITEEFLFFLENNMHSQDCSNNIYVLYTLSRMLYFFN